MWRMLQFWSFINRNAFCWNGLDHIKSFLLKLGTGLVEDVDDLFQYLAHWRINELYKSTLRGTLLE